MDETEYAPLRMPPEAGSPDDDLGRRLEAEEVQSRLTRRMLPLLRLLDRWFPSHGFYPRKLVPDCVQHMHEQLANRRRFPSKRWASVSHQNRRIKALLHIIFRELWWANNHFIPEDSLQYVLYEAGRDNLLFICSDVEKLSGVTISVDWLLAVAKNGWKVREFVEYILDRWRET